LGEHCQAIKVRIDSVGEWEVYDTVFTGKGHGRLGAFFPQDTQSAASSAGKNEGENSHEEPPLITGFG
jgi:hypothetical protein